MSLAINQGDFIPPAYGVVRDMSEKGVRILSDRVLWQGQRLRLSIRFDAEPELLEVRGRVRWHCPGEPLGETSEGSSTGIELSFLSESSGKKLRTILSSERFTARVEPDDVNRVFTPLTPYLERVADLFVQLAPRSPKS